jgi:hypothetical protein
MNIKKAKGRGVIPGLPFHLKLRSNETGLVAAAAAIAATTAAVTTAIVTTATAATQNQNKDNNPAPITTTTITKHTQVTSFFVLQHILCQPQKLCYTQFEF